MKSGAVRGGGHWQYLFVVGCQRSGTTILRRLVARSNDCIELPAETAFFINFDNRFGPLDRLSDRRRLLNWFVKSYGFTRTGLDPIAFTRRVLARNLLSYRGLLDEFVTSYLSSLGERDVKYVVEKTPTHSMRIGQILDSIPDSKFIAVKRDPYEVVDSMFSKGIYRLKLLPVPRRWKMLATYYEWERHDLALERAAIKYPSQVLVVIYRELQSEGIAKSVDEIEQFLSIPVERDEFLPRRRPGELRVMRDEEKEFIERAIQPSSNDGFGLSDIFNGVERSIVRNLFSLEVYLVNSSGLRFKRLMKKVRGDKRVI